MIYPTPEAIEACHRANAVHEGRGNDECYDPKDFLDEPGRYPDRVALTRVLREFSDAVKALGDSETHNDAETALGKLMAFILPDPEPTPREVAGKAWKQAMGVEPGVSKFETFMANIDTAGWELRRKEEG